MKNYLLSASLLHPLCLCAYLFLSLATLATAKPPTRQSPVVNRQFTTSSYGLGTRTTDHRGRTYFTNRYGNGTRTTGPGGTSYQTSRYGNGTITRGTFIPLKK
jgi:hypothetical protein